MQDVRAEYHAPPLNSDDLLDNPIAQARLWTDEAVASEEPLPNAMTLATVDQQGQPSTRTVLLKGVTDEGFVFYTHYDSRKGREIASNSRVSFVMRWPTLDRQLIVMGRAQKVSAEMSRAYFSSRPRGSQLSATVSPQSHAAERDWLEAEVKKLAEQYPEGTNIPAPASWGGFLIVPHEIEFWHGRPSRLHDRFHYTLHANGQWSIDRLAP